MQATRRVTTMIAATLLTAVAGMAQDAFADERLARTRQCFACHHQDRKLVGPSYRDVAARYRDDPVAEARLSVKIRTGGAGAWGTLAMAPNPALTEAESQMLARWVLSLR